MQCYQQCNNGTCEWSAWLDDSYKYCPDCGRPIRKMIPEGEALIPGRKRDMHATAYRRAARRRMVG